MPFASPKRIAGAALGFVLAASLSSCSLLTFDCGGPTSRDALAEATVRDGADTLSVDPIVAVYEERDHDGSYQHQLQIGIQATDAAHYDTIPSAGCVSFPSRSASTAVLARLGETSLPVG
jgi:hypothetical protein